MVTSSYPSEEGQWQRLGVHRAKASEASRSGVNTKTLRAAITGCSLLRSHRNLLASPRGSLDIVCRTHPAQIGLPHLSDQDVPQIDQTLAGSGWLESHRIPNERFSDKSLSSLPPDLSIASNAPHLPQTRVPYSGQSPALALAAIDLCGRPLTQRFVRSHLVVSSDPSIRAPLLRSPMNRRKPCRFGLEHPMHLFVSAILFGMSWSDKFHSNRQGCPPRAQTRKARWTGRSKGAAVVHTDDFRVAMPAKQSHKFSADRLPTLIFEQPDAQQIPTEQIPHGQRFYPLTILRPKPAFEIDCPHVVASLGHRQARPVQWRSPTRATAPPPVQPHSLEPIADRSDRRRASRAMLFAQTRCQFPAAPASMAPAQSAYPCQPSWGNLARAASRSPRSIFEPTQSIALESLDPFVANPAAESKFSTKCGDRSLGLGNQLHKLQTPHHTGDLFPRHACGKGPN